MQKLEKKLIWQNYEVMTKSFETSEGLDGCRASLHPGAANWGCHSRPLIVYRTLFFTGGLWQLVGLTTAHITPGKSWDLDATRTCQTFVFPNSTLVRGGGKKTGLGGRSEWTCAREMGSLSEEQRDTEIRSENVKQLCSKSSFLSTKRSWESN